MTVVAFFSLIYSGELLSLLGKLLESIVTLYITLVSALTSFYNFKSTPSASSLFNVGKEEIRLLLLNVVPVGL